MGCDTNAIGHIYFIAFMKSANKVQQPLVIDLQHPKDLRRSHKRDRPVGEVNPLDLHPSMYGFGSIGSWSLSGSCSSSRLLDRCDRRRTRLAYFQRDRPVDTD